MGNMTETANYHQVVGEVKTPTDSGNQQSCDTVVWIDHSGNMLQFSPTDRTVYTPHDNFEPALEPESGKNPNSGNQIVQSPHTVLTTG